MIEPVARDSAARILRWTRGEQPLLTPLALAVDLPSAPAPAGRLVLSREPRVRDAVVAGGSRFYPRGADTAGFLVIDDDLPYPPAAGADLVKAGHEENFQEHLGDRAFVALDPAGRIPADAQVVAMGAARAVLDNPYVFAKHVTTLRETIGPERLLYLPGCGLPHEIALLAYCGVDLIDDAAAVLAARQGAYLTPEGPIPAAAARDSGLPNATDLVQQARDAVQHEIARVHAAIRAGKLRELVEQRSRATPDLAAHLRRLDKDRYHFFETRAPLLREGRVYATSKESLDRPEMVRFRRRLARRYRKPTSARILVLLPCSSKKPYALSKTHRILFSALDRVRNRAAVHEVVLTSPLGVVPRELETVYPAAQYDLPVTGHWDEDEKLMIRDAVTALVERSRYDAIVVHLDEVEMEIVAPVLGDFHYTSEGDPLAPHSLENLASTLNKLADAAPRVAWGQRVIDDMSSLARFQFGEAGQALLEGAVVRGKMPFMKVLDADTNEQLAMTTEGRGYLSLAIEGGRRMMDAGMYRVEIDDFRPKGTIFAVGVRSADAEIAPEDEVLVHHDGEFRGVGRALVSGLEMGRMTKGACVSMRHTAPAAKTKEAR
ncbi:MAG TPA: archaeosine synthase subunit alpha [Candidatus Thermoplasmatota archaeon]|nr:archaeosine synthase subunit alpha [Candidatus Thermoplasmatota archaeon]